MEKPRHRVAFCKLSGCDGLYVDREGAVSLLEELAIEGDDEALWMLGLCCEYGIGAKQDVDRAEALYIQSCERGNVVGRLLLENSDCGRGTGVMKAKGLWNERFLFCESRIIQFYRADMSLAMKSRLGEMMRIAPWTSLDISSEHGNSWQVFFEVVSCRVC